MRFIFTAPQVSVSQPYRFIKRIISQGVADQAPRLSAALAFYTVFSLAPILIVAIALAGLVFGQKTALDAMVDQIQRLIGRQGADTVEAMIEASAKLSANRLATFIGVLTLLFGTTGAIVELQDGLNRVWKVKTIDTGVNLIKQRFASLALVAGIAFLLLVSLVISAVLSAVAKHSAWHGADFVLSCFFITALFAMIFKIVPDVFIRWGDVWVGAAVTAVLFSLGKLLMGFYIGQSAAAIGGGTAASFIALLTWVYYSAIVLYFGAEFTKAYADMYGSRKNAS